MQISINSISDKKYYNNFCKKMPKQLQNPTFGMNKLAQNQIESKFYRGLSGIDFNKTNLITENEIVKLLANCKNKISDFEKLKTEYGKEIGEKLFNALRFQNNEFFAGDNPNARINNHQSYLNKFVKFTEEEKFNLITRYANLNNGKYLDFWRNNPEKLLMSVNMNTYLPSQLKNFNSETWSAILDSYTKVFDHKDKAEIIDAMSKYTFDMYSKKVNFLPQINELLDNLIAKVENKQITYPIFQKEIKKIYRLIEDSRLQFSDDLDVDLKFKNYIKSYTESNSFSSCSSELIANHLRNDIQRIINEYCEYDKIKMLIENLKKASITSTEKESKIPLWRDDNICFFNSLNSDEINLTDLMTKAYFRNLKSQNEVLNYFNNKKPTINRRAFLSTAIKPYQFAHTPIKWNLTLRKGVNYLYISQITDQLDCQTAVTEAELLVHPCTLKINRAKYDNDSILVLEADILPPEENLSKESLI